MFTLNSLANCENEVIRELARKVHLEQIKCSHDFNNELKVYNINKKQCRKCAYVQSY